MFAAMAGRRAALAHRAAAIRQGRGLRDTRRGIVDVRPRAMPARPLVWLANRCRGTFPKPHEFGAKRTPNLVLIARAYACAKHEVSEVEQAPGARGAMRERVPTRSRDAAWSFGRIDSAGSARTWFRRRGERRRRARRHRGRAHRYVRPSGPALARRMRETACVKRRRAAARGARRARREASVPCTANGSARGPPSGAPPHAARRPAIGHDALDARRG
ncbi:hypothetical protein, partial [Burkholderia pseudomallei]|uniref:hypothetical protein n=1 Tax=Burkholderia pseudomallei TaxID=28450 RepID=UPI001C4B2FDA